MKERKRKTSSPKRNKPEVETGPRSSDAINIVVFLLVLMGNT